jgi:hypothetical protein
METIIISLLLALFVAGAYFLSLQVRETREKMFKEMEKIEEEEFLAKAENLQRFEKRYEPVVKPEIKPETPTVAESQPETAADVKPKKKKKSNGRRGRPAKPKGESGS